MIRWMLCTYGYFGDLFVDYLAVWKGHFLHLKDKDKRSLPETCCWGTKQIWTEFESPGCQVGSVRRLEFPQCRAFTQRSHKIASEMESKCQCFFVFLFLNKIFAFIGPSTHQGNVMYVWGINPSFKSNSESLWLWQTLAHLTLKVSCECTMKQLSYSVLFTWQKNPTTDMFMLELCIAL